MINCDKIEVGNQVVRVLNPYDEAPLGTTATVVRLDPQDRDCIWVHFEGLEQKEIHPWSKQYCRLVSPSDAAQQRLTELEDKVLAYAQKQWPAPWREKRLPNPANHWVEPLYQAALAIEESRRPKEPSAEEGISVDCTYPGCEALWFMPYESGDKTRVRIDHPSGEDWTAPPRLCGKHSPKVAEQ